MIENNKKIAIVVQRCGPEILAGAEVYALKLAIALAEKNANVEIHTSMSDDYINWNNHLNQEEWIPTSGKSLLIKRYPVEHNRKRILFGLVKRINFKLNKYLNKFYILFSSFLDFIFLKSQGPWCPSLWKYLKENEYEYSLIIVKSYLYSPNHYSLLKTSSSVKKLFIVTAHEEPEFKLNFVYKSLNKSDILGFVSQAEKKLCHKIWPISNKKPSILLPPGIDTTDINEDSLSHEIKEITNKKFFIYIGRIDKNKNIEFIFNHTPKNCFIVFAGDLKIEFPNDPRFKYIGRITEFEKKLLLKKALALVITSRLEAYSIITAESIFHNCLVLALKGCEPIDELIENYGGLSLNELEFNQKMAEIWENKFDKNSIQIKSTKIKEEKTWESNAIKILNILKDK
ncbi:glycosyltransferase [Silvanigrella sp.]|uniref:glycosyltransferase n=1 Tax=Silvanigrella sp. TaxID=2024976 RepID=UPI0037C92E81